MYMIGWLCMLKIYQTRHPDINPQAHIAYFCAAFVIFIAVIGVVSTERAPGIGGNCVSLQGTVQNTVLHKDLRFGPQGLFAGTVGIDRS